MFQCELRELFFDEQISTALHTSPVPTASGLGYLLASSSWSLTSPTYVPEESHGGIHTDDTIAKIDEMWVGIGYQH